VRSDLARVQFVQEDAFKKVKVLSGGELVKLQILLLMLAKPDILILDEPTNHLDIDSKNIIEDIFEEYDGPIIFISHDRYFINKVATKIIKLDSEAHVFTGNYEEYMNSIKSQAAVKKTEKKKKPKENMIRVRENIEKDILKVEEDLKSLHESLFLEEIYLDKKMYLEKEELIRIKEEVLEDLYIKLEEIDNLSE
jgi:ATP-binding cassette subfamily F protein 3